MVPYIPRDVNGRHVVSHPVPDSWRSSDPLALTGINCASCNGTKTVNTPDRAEDANFRACQTPSGRQPTYAAHLQAAHDRAFSYKL